MRFISSGGVLRRIVWALLELRAKQNFLTSLVKLYVAAGQNGVNGSYLLHLPRRT